MARDANGSDLATARVDLAPVPARSLRLRTEPVPPGTDVCTYGYPLTQPGRLPGGGMTFELQPRFLQGYVTRVYHRDDPRFGRTASYELDMLAPAGLSGAPLLVVGTTDVVGVVYGSAASYTIAEQAHVDPDTGEATPEVQRIVAFGLAHYTETLARLAGPATGGVALAEYLGGLQP